MCKIAICGCGGAGKSAVARRLGDQLTLPVTHLDTEYYDERWDPLPQDGFAAIQRRLVAQERWVLDGNYVSTMPIRLAAADTVLFLDINPMVWCARRSALCSRRHPPHHERPCGPARDGRLITPSADDDHRSRRASCLPDRALRRTDGRCPLRNLSARSLRLEQRRHRPTRSSGRPPLRRGRARIPGTMG